jgi:pyridoxamine 5'-phosphate oxidase
MTLSLADLRREYTYAGLRRSDLLQDPLLQLEKWLSEAVAAGVLEPTAMTLATADSSGFPSARTVLLKGIGSQGLTFYTNYQSQKGNELAENPRAALVLHWREIERQVCIRGQVSKTSREDSVEYFNSRPEGSRLAAWVSNQSQPIPNRQFLEARLEEVRQQFNGGEIPTPEHWGGYLLLPLSVEFWQGRPNRLHDRFRYSRAGKAEWKIERLSP